jgi:PmbA protein
LSDLLGVFLRIFSAKVAQEGKSLLAGREGEAIASPLVTLVDDPHDLNGMGARPFDAEGTWTRPFTLVENGVFLGFMHGQETARRAGCASTGHAVRGGYRGSLDVGPSNLVWRPGERSRDELMSAIGDGILVTDLTGLHAGANAISGDFSLQAEGLRIEGGRLGGAVHGFTVAGNFYRLLQDVVASASDLDFQSGSIATPSVWIRSLAIAGS